MKILVVGENNQDRNERYLMKLDDILLLCYYSVRSTYPLRGP
jgi:hypothetical protein